MAPPRKKLGDILLEMGAVDALQLKAALGHADQWGLVIGRALVEKGFCSEADVTRALSLQTGLPILDLDAHPLDQALSAVVPMKVAERHRVIPLRIEGKRQEVLVVGVGAPATLETLDEVRSVSRKQRVVAFVVPDTAMDRALEHLYHGKPRIVPNAPQVSIPAGGPAVPKDAPFDLAPEPAAKAEEPKVWLLGWHDARQKALQQMLKLAQVDALPLLDDALERCAATDVVLSSTLALQALLPAGERFENALLIICGLAGDTDIQDAKSVGAKMYLRPPFSPEQLARAIKSLQAS